MSFSSQIQRPQNKTISSPLSLLSPSCRPTFIIHDEERPVGIFLSSRAGPRHTAGYGQRCQPGSQPSRRASGKVLHQECESGGGNRTVDHLADSSNPRHSPVSMQRRKGPLLRTQQVRASASQRTGLLQGQWLHLWSLLEGARYVHLCSEGTTTRGTMHDLIAMWLAVLCAQALRQKGKSRSQVLQGQWLQVGQVRQVHQPVCQGWQRSGRAHLCHAHYQCRANDVRSPRAYFHNSTAVSYRSAHHVRRGAFVDCRAIQHR